MINYFDGDLIKLAKEGAFDVITHGLNCQNTQKAGIAPQMVKAFRTDSFNLEKPEYKGDINKLGCIDYERLHFSKLDQEFQKYPDDCDTILHSILVVNSYTQYYYGKNHLDGVSSPVDYDAIRLCMRKINHNFKGKHIGLPKIGAGLGGGSWDIISKIIETELKDMVVTVVNYAPNK